MFVKLSPYLIALLIGFLVGVERERRQLEVNSAMGLRSFMAIALGGAIAGGVNQPLIAVGLLVFAALATIFGYMRSSRINASLKKSVGITTELAAMVVFGLGFMAHQEPFLSLALGVFLLLFLHNKTVLHTFVRTYLTPDEIQGAGVLLLLAVGLLPLLPNKPIDPLGVFNPYYLGLIISLLAGMQFIGYVAVRIFGEEIGIPMSGFFAGIISSTAAFMNFAGQAKEQPELSMHFVSAGAFATMGALSKLYLLICVVSWRMALALLVPMGSIILASAIIGIICARNHLKSKRGFEHPNPLKLAQAIKFGVLLTSIIMAVTLVERYFGSAVTQIVTFIAGLADLDGVTMASASMLERKTISVQYAAATAMNAIIASMVSKALITVSMAQGKYQKISLSVVVILSVVAVAMLVLIYMFPAIMLSYNS